MFDKLMRQLVVVGLVFGVSVAHAQIPTTDVASIAKLMVMTAIQEAQEELLRQQVIESKNAANSLQNQIGSALNTDQMGDLQNIQNSARAANASNGLLNANSGSGTMQQLQTIYQPNAVTGRPDYDTYMGGTKDTIRGAISNNGAILESMPSEASRLNSLVSQSNRASGTLEAQQAGNQINAELAAQIQKQRQQQAVQAQADSTAALAAAEEKQQKANDSKAATNMFMFTRPR